MKVPLKNGWTVIFGARPFDDREAVADAVIAAIAASDANSSTYPSELEKAISKLPEELEISKVNPEKRRLQLKSLSSQRAFTNDDHSYYEMRFADQSSDPQPTTDPQKGTKNMIYLIPRNTMDRAVTEQLRASGIKILLPETIREMILASNDDATYVIGVSTPMIVLLASRKKEFFAALPRVLTGVPGVSYLDWLQYANQFPMEDWINFVDTIRRSGSTWTSVDDEKLPTRGRTDVDPRTSHVTEQADPIEDPLEDDDLEHDA